MPLRKGSDRATIASNIKEMVAAGHPHDQAVAASLHTAGYHSMARKAHPKAKELAEGSGPIPSE